MDAVRLATPEEIAAIESTSDLSYGTSVFTMGGKDMAVVRNCYEIDPMYFAEDSGTKRKLIFAMNLESILRFQGIKEIYFNVKDGDDDFRGVVETWGAHPTSTAPEIRYKKVL
jgi:hypothetical protein